MNIWTQCCGIILLFVIFLFYKQQKMVHLTTERAFWRSFCVTVITVTLDILSLIAIDNMNILPLGLVEFACKSYLVALLGVVLCSLLYICADIYTKDGQYGKHVKRYLLIAMIGIVFIYLLPIQIYHNADNSVMYTYGASVYVTYVFDIGFVLINLCSMIRRKDRINPRRRDAVFIWMGLWLLAAAVQFFNRSILIVGYACAVGMVVLYLKLENPEMNLDRRSGFFNQHTFFEYTKQLFERKQKYSILCIYFERMLQKNEQSDLEERVEVEVCQYLLKLPDTLVFKNTEDEIVLLFHDSEKAMEAIKKIWNRFDEGWSSEHSVFLRPCGIYIPDSDMVEDFKDIPELIKYVRENEKEHSGDYYIVDEDIISDMYREKEMAQLIVSAIEYDRIEVFYQPIFSTKEKKFTCAEALVRMRDEQGKLIPPMSLS